MGRLLLVVMMLLPLIEIALFVIIGGAVGLWPTLLGVLLAALLGSLLLRSQGRAFVSQVRGTMFAAVLPGQAIADAMMVGAAGVLLIIPGYFSDIVALALLVPAVRGAIYGWLRSRVSVVGAAHTSYSNISRPSAPPTIELDDKDWRQR